MANIEDRMNRVERELATMAGQYAALAERIGVAARDISVASDRDDRTHDELKSMIYNLAAKVDESEKRRREDAREHVAAQARTRNWLLGMVAGSPVLWPVAKAAVDAGIG